MSGFVEGSEPELREDEAVCPVSNFAFNRHLPRSPWVDEDGKQAY